MLDRLNLIIRQKKIKHFGNPKEHSEVEKKVKEALDKIVHLEGLEIEIIGVWIWVSGDTKTHKEILKEAGFKWNKTMVKWFLLVKNQMVVEQ